MVAAPLVLKTAIKPCGWTRPLLDGRVTPAGMRIDNVEVTPIIAAFRRMVRGLEFDVCEMAPTTYMVAREFNKAFTAIPVFLARSFHHSTVVYNIHSGIREPKDLEGKKAGVRAYTVTAGVWTRGILSSEYGVDLAKVTWVTDDQEHVEEYVAPSNVVKAPPGKSLAEMIVTGEIAVALSGMAGIGRTGAPSANWTSPASPPDLDANVRPLIPQAKAVEAEWYRRTRIHPIHDLVVIRNSLLESYPQIATELFYAFKASKEMYLGKLAEAGPTTAEDRTLMDSKAVVGGDPLPYGVGRTRETLEALIEYAYDQKIIRAKCRPEDLFAPGTADLD